MGESLLVGIVSGRCPLYNRVGGDATRLSVVSCQLSVVSCQLSKRDMPLTTDNLQLTKLQRPPLTILRLDKVLRLRHVGHAEVGSVPLQLLAELDGDIAEQNSLR